MPGKALSSGELSMVSTPHGTGCWRIICAAERVRRLATCASSMMLLNMFDGPDELVDTFEVIECF